MNYNNLVIVGRATSDLRVSATATGTLVVDFTIATERRTQDGQKNVSFIPIKTFSKTAEAVQKYISKGMEMLVQGELITEKITSPTTGKQYSVLKVYANRVCFGSLPKNGNGESGDGAESGTKPATPYPAQQMPSFTPPTEQPQSYGGFDPIKPDAGEEIPF